MDEHDWLAEQFEAHRDHLRAVAYRMLGSHSETDDAIQETWLRLSHTDAGGVVNLRGWLTTVVARICLDLLRARGRRREQPLEPHLPDPVVTRFEDTDPEQQLLLADSVGLALLVVLDTLTPAERLAFVLHDMFAVPFDEVAGIVGRSTDATKQLASRARRRVRGAAPAIDTNRARQRELVEAFLRASREGDLTTLVSILDPQVVARAEGGAGQGSSLVRGARSVAGQAVIYRSYAQDTQLVLVNSAVGVLTSSAGRPVALLAFTIARGRITAIDILADRDRLSRLSLPGPAAG